MAETCSLCGKPAEGYAKIGDARYCHGDGTMHPTCYQQGLRTIAFGGLGPFLDRDAAARALFATFRADIGSDGAGGDLDEALGRNLRG